MKLHTTNCFDTFIEVAEETRVQCGTVPPERGDKKTVAALQFGLIANNPYKYSSDDVIFLVHAERNDLPPGHIIRHGKPFSPKARPVCGPLP